MNKLDKDYIELLKDILDNGNSRSDRTDVGTKSVFGRQIRHSMTSGFPVLTSKKMAFKGIATELLWFLQGNTNIKQLLENGSNIWNGDCYKMFQKLNPDSNLSMIEFIEKIKTDDEFSKQHGDLGPIYGHQWRKWGGPSGPVDQISNLINDLKNNPDSRRLIVNAWNVGELDQMTLPPCHLMYQLYTRELSVSERIEMSKIFCNDKLPDQHEEWNEETLDRNNIPRRSISLNWVQRSVDCPLGLPFNISSYGLLLTIFGRFTNMFPEELIGSLVGDCHIYNNQINGVKEQIERTSFDLPKLIIADHVDFSQGIDEMLASCTLNDFKLDGYQSHPAIKFPLSN